MYKTSRHGKAYWIYRDIYIHLQLALYSNNLYKCCHHKIIINNRAPYHGLLSGSQALKFRSTNRILDRLQRKASTSSRPWLQLPDPMALTYKSGGASDHLHSLDLPTFIMSFVRGI
jgi:hypothetical protein